MPLEPFVYLTVFLLLTGLFLFSRWLNEKLQKEIDLRDLFRPSEEAHAPETVTPPGESRREPGPIPSRPPGRRERRRRVKLPLHSKSDLRQGILLMTILGPCRALDSESTTPFNP